MDMRNASRLAITMLVGAIAVPVLAYVTCGEGYPPDVIRIFWAFIGAVIGFAFEMTRRANQS